MYYFIILLKDHLIYEIKHLSIKQVNNQSFRRNQNKNNLFTILNKVVILIWHFGSLQWRMHLNVEQIYAVRRLETYYVPWGPQFTWPGWNVGQMMANAVPGTYTTLSTLPVRGNNNAELPVWEFWDWTMSVVAIRSS